MAAATRKGNCIIFTAITDTYAGQIVSIAGITFRGTGLTSPQQVLLTDDQGDVIVDYDTEGTTVDNQDLWNGRPAKFYMGLKMTGTVAGTWALTVFLE